MKGLTKSGWDTVVGGKDKPYTTLMDKIKSDNEIKSDNKRDKHQPEGMDSKEFIDMVDNGIYPVIKNFYDSKVENERLENNVKSLERKIKSLEKSKNENLQKISELSGVVKGMESVSGNLQNLETKQQKKKV